LFKRRKEEKRSGLSRRPCSSTMILKIGLLLEWSVRRCRRPSVEAAQAGSALRSMWGRTSWPVLLPASHNPSCSDWKAKRQRRLGASLTGSPGGQRGSVWSTEGTGALLSSFCVTAYFRRGTVSWQVESFEGKLQFKPKLEWSRSFKLTWGLIWRYTILHLQTKPNIFDTGFLNCSFALWKKLINVWWNKNSLGLPLSARGGVRSSEHSPVNCVSFSLCRVLDVGLIQQLLDPQQDLETVNKPKVRPWTRSGPTGIVTVNRRLWCRTIRWFVQMYNTLNSQFVCWIISALFHHIFVCCLLRL